MTNWKSLRNELFGFIQRRIRNPSDAEDVLQDVFLRSQARVNQLRDATQRRSWMFGIARNAVTDYHRQRIRSLQAVPEREVPDRDPSSATSTDPAIRSCIQLNIARLPEKYREALLLTDVEGLKQKDVAVRLGLSLPGTKSRVQRGRARLRHVVSDCCNLEFDAYGSVVTQECLNQACSCCAPSE